MVCGEVNLNVTKLLSLAARRGWGFVRTVHGTGPAETEANILGLGTCAQRGGEETGGHSDEIRVLGLRGVR